jgi:hypothetical protein
MVVKVFDELGPRYATRNGGYLRILKCGFRVGDNAPMALSSCWTGRKARLLRARRVGAGAHKLA